MPKEQKSFQAETKQILEIMIHSLYSHKEIFLRELISNASDAIEKLQFHSTTNDKILQHAGGELKIQITPNKEAKTLTISENGIGMNKEDIINHNGTKAKSGTKEFAEKIKKAKNEKSSESELIGKFGVGFYSGFMVSDKMEVHTRKAGEEKGYVWTCSGGDAYEIEEKDKKTTGTTITLHLKNDELNFLDTWKIKEIIKKYSDFISYPIELHRKEVQKDKEGKDELDKDKKPVLEDKTEIANSMKAIWKKSKSE